MRKLLLLAAVAAPAASTAQMTETPPRTAPAPAATPAVTAAQAAAAPTGSAEVAGIVSREFPSYDKNGDGTLDAAEFGDWMVKLKTIADPASTANAAAVRTWVNAAFAQADADRSKSLTLGELTGFLIPARS